MVDRRFKMRALIPRQTEKSFAQSQTLNTYVFDVPVELNKHTVARIIASDYGVTVEDVRIVVIKGKTKRFVRRGGRQNSGVTADVKKAYVRVKNGDAIPVFVGATEEEKNTPEAATPKRGLLGRSKVNNTGAASTAASVTRTQAKVGEK
jgi:large subunit ribosomal protein L23